jgi:hypothetical protein
MNRYFRQVNGPEVFVGGAWLALTAAALGYVLRFGAPELYADEWDLAGGLTYTEPYLGWLWAQHNEHRLPLPKLIYTALLNISGFDARAGCLATVTVLSALALALIVGARRLRGSTEYADAFFPTLLLNWGHFENLLMGFQVSFALSVGLVVNWMLAALRASVTGNQPSGRGLAWPLLLLPFCGAHGLAYVPTLGLATLWLTRRADRPGRIATAAAVLTSFAMAAVYFRGYSSPAGQPAPAGVWPSLVIAGEVLSLGWGWAGQMTWPASAILTVMFVLATALLIRVVQTREERLCDEAVAILAVAAGALALAMAIGRGRSGFGPLAGFAVRYALLMVPLMAAGYLAWVRFGGRLLGSLVPMGLFTVTCLFLTQHFRTALAEGRHYAHVMNAFAADLNAGLAPDDLARRHPKLHPDPVRLAQRIHTLKAAGIRRYDAVATQPPPTPPVAAH